MTKPRSSVLIVEDQPLIAQLMADIVGEELGHDVVGPARSIDAAMALFHEHRCGAALVDVSLPDGSGLDLIRRLVAEGVRCAAVTGLAPVDDLPDVRWLRKPVDPTELRAFLDEATA